MTEADTPRLFVKADDDGAGLITVYAQALPDTYDPPRQAGRWTELQYNPANPAERHAAQRQAERIAARWAALLNGTCPTEWGANY